MLITEITVDSVADDGETALKVIKRGNLYVSKFAGANFLFSEKKGKSNIVKVIIYNSEFDLEDKYDIPLDWFAGMFAFVVLHRSEDHYEITGNRDNLIECYKGIGKSLMSFHASMYKKFGVRLEP